MQLKKFHEAQRMEFYKAYSEIQEGKKRSHWIWYIFPQIKGLGYSDMTKNFELQSLEEAKLYLKDNYLRNNLINILRALLKHYRTKNIIDIMGSLDAKKLLSCMTLFKEADQYNICNNIFAEVINKFYNGKEDIETLNRIKPNYYFNYPSNKDNISYLHNLRQNDTPYKIMDHEKLQHSQEINYKSKSFGNNILSNNQNQLELIDDYEQNKKNESYSNLPHDNIHNSNYHYTNSNKEKDHDIYYSCGGIKYNNIFSNYRNNINNISDIHNVVENEYCKMNNYNINSSQNESYNIITGEKKNINQLSHKKPIQRTKRSYTFNFRLNQNQNNKKKDPYSEYY